MGHEWWAARVLQIGPVFLAAWIVWIIASITLHELAHGWAAIRRGDSTPIDSGHMTFNPVVHMGIASLAMFAISGIAWGAMPIDPTRFKGKYAEAWVAFAGPLTNMALACACVIGGAVCLVVSPPHPDDLLIDALRQQPVFTFFYVGATLNITLACFNLLPIFPLDGGRIAGNFFPAYQRFSYSQFGGFFSAALYVVAFLFGGQFFFDYGRDLTIEAMGQLARLAYWLASLSGTGTKP